MRVVRSKAGARSKSGARSTGWRSYVPGTPLAAPTAVVARAAGAATRAGLPARSSATAAARAASAAAAIALRQTTVRVLGLDPGSQNTGFGVVESGPAGTRYVASGAIRAGSGEFATRLQTIYAGVAALVAEHRPDEIAIERVFVHRNPDSALKLGQARGAALCATFAAQATLHEYSPREVKLAIVGFGGAEKDQIQRMVKALLGLQGRLGADAADALAIALCHAHGRAARASFAAAAGAR